MGVFLLQEYSFKVQVANKGGDEKMITVGKADIDLARFVCIEGTPQNKMIPIIFKVGQTTTGYLKVVIVTEMVKGGVDEDGMTEVSGITGITTSMEGFNEQDLSGTGSSLLFKDWVHAGKGISMQ